MEHLAKLSEMNIPEGLKGLKDKDIRFTRSIEIKDGMHVIANRMKELHHED